MEIYLLLLWSTETCKHTLTERLFYLFFKRSRFETRLSSRLWSHSDRPQLRLRARHWISAPRTDVCRAELIWPWRLSASGTETHSHSAVTAPETSHNINLDLFIRSSNLFLLLSEGSWAAKAYLVKCRETFRTGHRSITASHRQADIHNHPCGQSEVTRPPETECVWTVGGNSGAYGQNTQTPHRQTWKSNTAHVVTSHGLGLGGHMAKMASFDFVALILGFFLTTKLFYSATGLGNKSFLNRNLN